MNASTFEVSRLMLLGYYDAPLHGILTVSESFVEYEFQLMDRKWFNDDTELIAYQVFELNELFLDLLEPACIPTIAPTGMQVLRLLPENSQAHRELLQALIDARTSSSWLLVTDSLGNGSVLHIAPIGRIEAAGRKGDLALALARKALSETAARLSGEFPS